MKVLRAVLLFSAFAMSIFASPSWAAGAVSGYYYITINGYLRTPITATGVVECTGYIYTAPKPSAGLTLANISTLVLANSATVNASSLATIQPNKQNFTCNITLPYYVNSFDSATQSFIFVYNVKLNDQIFFNLATIPPTITPGSGVRSTRQTHLITVAPGGAQGLGPFTVML